MACISEFNGPTADFEKVKPDQRELEVSDKDFKNQEFRAIPSDNAREVSDAKNQAIQSLEEMFQMEADIAGIHTTFLTPKQPGDVIKTMTEGELEEYNKTDQTLETAEPSTIVKREPKYVIKYRHSTDHDVALLDDVTESCRRPSEIIVEVALPEMTSSKGIDLDVLEHLMTLESEVPEAYKLVLKLPYPVFEDQSAAKFDKSQHNLVVTLPVKEAKEPTDSGISLDFDIEDDAKIVKIVNNQDSSSSINLPPYNCNIYEGLMVLTIPVKNVVVDSLERSNVDGNKGYQLSFHTSGQGFHYGFCLAFDFKDEEGSCSMDDLEVEVWDNNIILQVCTPKSGCCNFRVGTNLGDLGEAMPLPRLEAVKEKCFKLNKDTRGDDCIIEIKDEDCKDRHSSGESQDSAISVSSHSSLLDHGPLSVSPSKRFLVTPVQVLPKDCKKRNRGILRQQRCDSESQACDIFINDPEENNDMLERERNVGSKKSVRFNEVVQRQIYRSSSSIMGQKNKNQKKAEQKRRKTDRRVSEGDAKSVDRNVNDSRLGSSFDEAGDTNIKRGNRGRQPGLKKVKGSPRFGEQPKEVIDGSTSDLIFDLDF
jgi:dynein assembly factor 2